MSEYMSVPLNVITPEVGSAKPRRILTVVLLPDPFAPMYPSASWELISNETFFRTVEAPYDFEIDCTFNCETSAMDHDL
jgi:hypothetical protein